MRRPVRASKRMNAAPPSGKAVSVMIPIVRLSDENRSPVIGCSSGSRRRATVRWERASSTATAMPIGRAV